MDNVPLALPCLYLLSFSAISSVAFVIHLVLRAKRAHTPALAPRTKADTHSAQRSSTDMAYILPTRVSHARAGRHSSSYPSLTLLLPLTELERGAHDLVAGRLFGYGNGAYAKLTGIRPAQLLSDDGSDGTSPIRHKVAVALAAQGLDKGRLGDVWAHTPPSYLASEAAAPLSVFYCYERVMAGQGAGCSAAPLWAVVLEIPNNTFCERAIYALDVGACDDPAESGYDHQWTVALRPHRSPLTGTQVNGQYIVAVKAPSCSPTSSSNAPLPLPAVRITHLTSGPNATPSLIAEYQPNSCLPMTSTNLLYSLLKLQFDLFYAMPGTIYQTLRVCMERGFLLSSKPSFACAEPRSPSASSDHTQLEDDFWLSSRASLLGWAQESFAETFARQRTEAFLRQRVQLEEMTVRLVCTSPTISIPTFEVAHPKALPHRTLTVHYRSTRFFTLLLATTDSEQAYALGAEQNHEFEASDKAMFTACFAPSYAAYRPLPNEELAHKLRCLTIPQDKRPQWLGHYLDEPASWSLIVVLAWLQCTAVAWRLVFEAVGTTFGASEEPWITWAPVKQQPEQQPILSSAGGRSVKS